VQEHHVPTTWWVGPSTRPENLGEYLEQIFSSNLRSPWGMNPYSQWLRFVGLLNDEPVAVSILFLGAGVAAIFNVAVVPEFRRQGLGTLITRAPLLRARLMGYRYGVLKATQMGTKLYKNMKFEKCCTIFMYTCRP